MLRRLLRRSLRLQRPLPPQLQRRWLPWLSPLRQHLRRRPRQPPLRRNARLHPQLPLLLSLHAQRLNSPCVLRTRRLVFRANSPRHAQAALRLRQRVRSNRARNRKPRALVRRQVHRARNNLYVPCPRETAGRFPELRRGTVTVGRVVRVRASRCAHNSLVGRADVRLHRVPEGREVLVDPVVDAHLGSGRERRLRARVRGRARPVVLECCPRRSPKSRPRRSRASRFMRASRNSASVRWRTSGRWKASGSSTRRGSVREQEVAEWPRQQLRHPSRVRRAISL